MKKLHPNWITEGLIDFEYKKYLLLAYLQYIAKNFNEQRLYPFLSDLIFHYKNLISLRDNKEIVHNKFPKKISKIDLENFRLEYTRLIEEDDCMEEIESILDFAIPRMKEHLHNGKEIYDEVEENINIEPIGILPINHDAGYMFLHVENQRDTAVYEYEISVLENVKERFRGLRTTYINSYSRSISNTFEKIKIELIQTNKSMPNPATYLVQSKTGFPYEATLLPIAKRCLVRYLATNKAS